MVKKPKARTAADSEIPSIEEPISKVLAATAQWAREQPGRDTAVFETVTAFTLIHQLMVGEFRSSAQSLLDMGAGDTRILLALRRSGPDYAQTPVQLKQNLFVTAGAITKQITRLEKRGLVERKPYKGSKRNVLIHLTPKGAETIDSVRRDHRMFPLFAEAYYSLTDEERETGRRFLRRLMGKLEVTRQRGDLSI